MKHLLLAAVWLISASVVSTAFAGTWQDNFQGGGLVDWIIYEFEPPVVGNWDEEGGFLVGESLQGHLSFLQLKPRKPAGVNTDNWQYYTVKVLVRLESEPILPVDADFWQLDQFTVSGIMLHGRLDPGNYATAYIRYEPRGQAYFGYEIWDREGNREVGERGPYNVARRKWYILTASIHPLEPETLAFQIWVHNYVTGEELGPEEGILIVSDVERISTGGVALVVGGGRVSFDDFVVEGDSIPDGRPWSVSPSGLSAELWAELKSR